jgi:hypothetical protein
MEEFLTGELDERDPDQVEERAKTLLRELTGLQEKSRRQIPILRKWPEPPRELSHSRTSPN